MEKNHRKLLLKNRLEFVKDLEANDITGYLFQEQVITENDKELIEQERTRRERSEYLLDLLPRKGPHAFLKFTKILLQFTCYEHLGRLLQDSSSAKFSEDCIDAGKKKRYSDFVTRPRSSSKRNEPDMLNSYTMTSIPRGWCFIINNVHFLTMSDRSGSDRDAQNLQNLFILLGFRVWLINDVDVDDIREKVTELSQKNDHGDALAVCILSHGIAGEIYGIDGETIAVSEMLDILSTGQTGVLLKGKPKLFLIQACRTNENTKQKHQTTNLKKIHRSEVVSSPISNSPLNRSSSPQLQVSAKHSVFIEQNNTHLQSDLLLGYSTLPGEVSWRNVNHGSYFIDTVVNIFTEYAFTEDVFSMLVKVNEKVYEILKERGQEQIPAPVLTLTKKLFLIPPNR